MFEIRTPLLKRVAEEMVGVFDGLKSGTLDRQDAAKIIGAGNTLNRTIDGELKVRLAAPKLAKAEAARAAAA